MSGKNAIPSVSDHAVLRYLERVMGVDVEAVRNSLLTPEVRLAIKLQAKSVTIQGVEFRVEGARIVTVIETKRCPTLRRRVPLRLESEASA